MRSLWAPCRGSRVLDLLPSPELGPDTFKRDMEGLGPDLWPEVHVPGRVNESRGTGWAPILGAGWRWGLTLGAGGDTPSLPGPCLSPPVLASGSGTAPCVPEHPWCKMLYLRQVKNDWRLLWTNLQYIFNVSSLLGTALPQVPPLSACTCTNQPLWLRSVHREEKHWEVAVNNILPTENNAGPFPSPRIVSSSPDRIDGSWL